MKAGSISWLPLGHSYAGAIAKKRCIRIPLETPKDEAWSYGAEIDSTGIVCTRSVQDVSSEKAEYRNGFEVSSLTYRRESLTSSTIHLAFVLLVWWW